MRMRPSQSTRHEAEGRIHGVAHDGERKPMTLGDQSPVARRRRRRADRRRDAAPSRAARRGRRRSAGPRRTSPRSRSDGWCRRARARASGMRFTSRSPSARSALARCSIQPVAFVSAGPPFVGLYLNPPSSGGLCDGVMTMPSASPVVRPRCSSGSRATRRAWAYSRRSRRSSRRRRSRRAPRARCRTPTPRARACRSRGTPVRRSPARAGSGRWPGSMARMCDSLNAPLSEIPRCPDVPNATRSSRRAGSGCIGVVRRDEPWDVREHRGLGQLASARIDRHLLSLSASASGALAPLGRRP